MSKTFRDHLPEGKIIGFQHNNLWFGDPADRPAPTVGGKGSKTKAALREGEDDYDYNVYLAYLDREADPPVGYTQLPGITGDEYFTEPYADNIDMFVLDCTHDWDDPSIVYDRSCVGTTTHQATLMDVLIKMFNDSGASDPPYISELDLTSDTLPQQNTLPDWLESLYFKGVSFPRDSDITGPYTDDDGTYYLYTGKDWLYFIGSPKDYDLGYTPAGTLHGSPYPKLRLDEFPVGALPLLPFGDPATKDIREFTLSYESQSYKIYVRSETVGGETVHTLIKPKELK
jgi:hypothetical protein